MEDVNKLLEFLGKLATDDKFREEYEKAPSKVLATYGVVVPDDTQAALPPKEVLVQALNALAADTTFPGSWMRQFSPWRGPIPDIWGSPWRGPIPHIWGSVWRGPFPGPWSWPG